MQTSLSMQTAISNRDWKGRSLMSVQIRICLLVGDRYPKFGAAALMLEPLVCPCDWQLSSIEKHVCTCRCSCNRIAFITCTLRVDAALTGITAEKPVDLAKMVGLDSTVNREVHHVSQTKYKCTAASGIPAEVRPYHSCRKLRLRGDPRKSSTAMPGSSCYSVVWHQTSVQNNEAIVCCNQPVRQ